MTDPDPDPFPRLRSSGTANSRTTSTQLSGVNFFPLRDEEEEEASSSESGAASPAPLPGINRIIEVEEPGRTPYPEEEPEHQVSQEGHLGSIDPHDFQRRIEEARGQRVQEYIEGSSLQHIPLRERASLQQHALKPEPDSEEELVYDNYTSRLREDTSNEIPFDRYIAARTPAISSYTQTSRRQSAVRNQVRTTDGGDEHSNNQREEHQPANPLSSSHTEPKMELDRINRFKEVFTGEKSQNIEGFRERFETWCSKNDRGNDYKTRYFSFLLDGAAFTCFKSLPREVKNDYQRIKQQFLAY